MAITQIHRAIGFANSRGFETNTIAVLNLLLMAVQQGKVDISDMRVVEGSGSRLLDWGAVKSWAIDLGYDPWTSTTRTRLQRLLGLSGDAAPTQVSAGNVRWKALYRIAGGRSEGRAIVDAPTRFDAERALQMPPGSQLIDLSPA